MANRSELKNKIAMLEYDDFMHKEEMEILQKEYADALVLIRKFINVSLKHDMSNNPSYQECLAKAREFTKEHDVHVIWIPEDILNRAKK